MLIYKTDVAAMQSVHTEKIRQILHASECVLSSQQVADSCYGVIYQYNQQLCAIAAVNVRKNEHHVQGLYQALLSTHRHGWSVVGLSAERDRSSQCDCRRPLVHGTQSAGGVLRIPWVPCRLGERHAHKARAESVAIADCRIYAHVGEHKCRRLPEGFSMSYSCTRRLPFLSCCGYFSQNRLY